VADRVKWGFPSSRAEKDGIESDSLKTYLAGMSTKEIVKDLLQRLPENVSLHDIAQ
jgi:hypothetical protein